MRDRGPARIEAAAGSSWQIEDALPTLRERVRAATDVSPRRVSRLIQLALMGAAECARGHALAPDCGLYLASGQGALADSVDVFTQMFVDGQAPKPISFVNTLSNTSCFYVAKVLGLSGPSQFVSSSALPLESALSLALLDLARGRVAQALVGGVDECVLPLSDHRKRLRTRPDAPLGEGTHWMLLSAARAKLVPGHDDADGIGTLRSVAELPHRAAFAAWLDDAPIDASACAVAFGAGVGDSDDERAWLEHATRGMRRVDYAPRAHYYETVTGAALCDFVTGSLAPDRSTTALLHVNITPDGRFGAFIAERARPA